MATEETTICPYCKEEIKTGAVKCKHCHSSLRETTPSHKGVCPYCKEKIQDDAIKCKHCKSSLVESMSAADCGCKGEGRDTQQFPYDVAMARRARGGLGAGSSNQSCYEEAFRRWFECYVTYPPELRPMCDFWLRWDMNKCDRGGRFGSGLMV